MMFSKTLLTICCAAAISGLIAQTVVNDNCADAISVAVGSECVFTDYTSIDATSEPTTVAPNPTCGGYQGGDVWFTFDVPASGNFRIEMSSAGNNSQWALYSGTCGDFTQLVCASSSNQLNSNFSDPNLAGETLYLRAFRFVSSEGIDFDLCIWEIDPPVNDYCADAIDLTVGESCSFQSFSSQYSTSEPNTVAPNPTCGGYQGGDVWFTFDAPSSGNFRIEMTSAGNNSQWALYSGTCGDFTQLVCASSSNQLNSNFSDPTLAGETLYLRAFRFVSTQGIDFDLCIWEIDPPVNDHCANAIDLPVGESCSFQSFSSQFSTSEPNTVAPNPTCGGYQGGDVWFTFDAPASGNFRIEMTSAGNNSQWALYSGTCGDFTQLVCASSSNQLNSNFDDPTLAGETLYLRAFRFVSTQGIDFDLCIWEIESPANDLCSDAIDLNMGESCSFQSFSSQLSTAQPTSIAPNPTCGGYQGGDVWFTFDVPASGNFRIEMTSAGNNSQWALYSGTCGDFVQVKCASGTNQLSSNFSDPTLAGETLYLRAFRFVSPQGIDFDLCVWEIDPPANNTCGDAEWLTLSDECIYTPYSSIYSTSSASEVVANPTCGAYQGGDVWFAFEAPASGLFTINRNQLSGSSTYLAVYTGTCGDFTEIACAADSEINFDDPTLGGQTVYIRSWAFANAQGSEFELCVVNNTIAPNDNCADAIALEVNQTCELELFNNFNTTEEPGIAPNPSCEAFSGSDVWFTFEMPETGVLEINRNNISGGDYYFAAYEGTCGSFDELACSDGDSNVVLNEPGIAGETLYLRLYRSNSPFGGEFELCLVAGDCNADIGGTAFIDECGTCVGGNTGLEACVQDCNGEFGGEAFIDNCGTCVGGSTGLEPCTADISGTVFFAYDCGDLDGTVLLYEPGTAILVESYSIEINAGEFLISDILPGNFDIYVKPEGFLQKLIPNVAIANGNNEIEIEDLIPGDFSGNNAVGTADFSFFSSNYGLNSTDEDFDQSADLDCNGAVGIPDFSLFSVNYGTEGDEPAAAQ